MKKRCTQPGKPAAFLAAMLLCFAAAAEINLLKNHGFDAPGAEVPGRVPYWKSTGGVSLRQTGGALELVTSPDAPQMRVEQFLRPAAGWGTLRFSCRIDIDRIEPVGNARFGVVPSIMFFGADRKILGTLGLDNLPGKGSGLHEYSCVFALPPGTAQLAVQFRINSAAATARVTRPVLEVLAAPGEAVDAPAPAGRTVDWGKEPVVPYGSDRGEIVLNGLWRFQPIDPALNRDNPAPKGWGFANVPGIWNVNSRVPGLAAYGGGPLWKRAPENAAAAWFRRPLDIPADWRGRQIELEFERVGTVAEVWLDGVLCGRVQHPGGAVDISAAAKPGERSQLTVRVPAVSDVTEILEIEGAAADQFYKKQVKLEGKGLTGDVVLRSRPAGGGYRGVFIQPSVREKKLKLEIEFAELDKAADWTITARVLKPDGSEAKRFPAHTVRLMPDPAGEAVVRLDCPWADPELWDLDRPNLYNLELALTGNGRTETVLERFGFREFHIEGREFFLNGRKFNLRPMVLSGWSSPTFTLEGMQGAIEGWRKAGFNIHEVWPQEDFPGKLVYPERACLDYAAETGWPVIADLPSMRSMRLTFLSDAKGAAEWQERVKAKLRKYRNNPAILMWVHSVNSFNGTNDQDPHYIGQPEKFFADGIGITNALPAGRRVSEILRKLDPTRPNFSHAGQIGDVYTANNYLSMIPLQEQEEWLSDYVQFGTRPYLAVEFGFIGGFDFRRGRSAYRFTNKTERQMTEHLAAFYGREAYEKESMQAACDNRNAFIGGQLYRSTDAFVPDKLALDLFARMNRQVFRSWRTAGCSGGMIPWMIKDGYDLGRLDKSLLQKSTATVKSPPFRPGRRGFYRPYLTREERYCIGPEAAVPNVAGKALTEVNSATLAWLGGAKIPGDRADFTEKSHSFYGGETLRKQVVLLNDLRQAADYSYELRLVCDGEELAMRRGTGIIDAAGKLLLPVEFKLPATGKKRDAELRLSARISGNTHSDMFKLRIFPPRPKPAEPEISVWDPKGDTTKFLISAGYRVQAAKTPPAPPALLVIGRDCLADGRSLPPNFGKFVADGGTLLVMAHRSYGDEFRYGRFVQRQVFPVDDTSPVIAGLDREDLRDWRGSGTLIEAYPKTTTLKQLEWGWHWGNRGSVASRTIEKPHHGGWTPLLESDFDLQYTPLMELARGKGGVIVCQLDFEDNLADPAAMRLFDNLIGYARNRKFIPRSCRTVYLGSTDGQKQLNSFGLVFRKADTIPGDADLILVGAGARTTRSELETAVKRGAKVAVLGPEPAIRLFGLDLQKKQEFRGSLNPPSWPEAAGMSASDLRWRSPLDAELLKPVPELEIGADGQLGRIALPGGSIILSLLDPERLNTVKHPYWRFTRWRQTRALNQLLANLGGVFETDKLFPSETPSVPTRIDFADRWHGKLLVPMNKAPAPLKDPGFSAEAKEAVKPEFDDSSWPLADLPFIWQRQAWNDPEWGDRNGEAVFRREIHLPPELAGKPLKLDLGVIDDGDDTFFNGKLVGRTGDYRAFRSYTVPGHLVKAGRNVIAVRIFDNFGDGGFTSSAKTFRIPLQNDIVGLYHTDYQDTDFRNADHPHRYHRW
ncbi:sugar-binding domain-containing protein [uncultured Victivallis sp.]|uniref:sugar-binding domain-containing protein n=1 Tax=uncultured Victivallis sp. TaxID=354118 RepID=UPI002584A194|nr:sugar-binding domain-containing protein [uncultured Victivallis sp.]